MPKHIPQGTKSHCCMCCQNVTLCIRLHSEIGNPLLVHRKNYTSKHLLTQAQHYQISPSNRLTEQSCLKRSRHSQLLPSSAATPSKLLRSISGACAGGCGCATGVTDSQGMPIPNTHLKQHTCHLQTQIQAVEAQAWLPSATLSRCNWRQHCLNTAIQPA
jgi:hypothetical protein